MEREDVQEMKDLIRDIMGLQNEAAQDMSIAFAMGVKTGFSLGEASANKKKEEEETRLTSL